MKRCRRNSMWRPPGMALECGMWHWHVEADLWFGQCPFAKIDLNLSESYWIFGYSSSISVKCQESYYDLLCNIQGIRGQCVLCAQCFAIPVLTRASTRLVQIVPEMLNEWSSEGVCAANVAVRTQCPQCALEKHPLDSLDSLDATCDATILAECRGWNQFCIFLLGAFNLCIITCSLISATREAIDFPR